LWSKKTGRKKKKPKKVKKDPSKSVPRERPPVPLHHRGIGKRLNHGGRNKGREGETTGDEACGGQFTASGENALPAGDRWDRAGEREKEFKLTIKKHPCKNNKNGSGKRVERFEKPSIPKDNQTPAVLFWSQTSREKGGSGTREKEERENRF